MIWIILVVGGWLLCGGLTLGLMFFVEARTRPGFNTRYRQKLGWFWWLMALALVICWLWPFMWYGGLGEECWQLWRNRGKR